MSSYLEATARQRMLALVDNFEEMLPPGPEWTSPHLPLLNAPVSFDDGVVVGSGYLQGQWVFAAAQEGGFMGGAVGEVHGAKLVGLMRRAVIEKPAALILLAESGGVRLHEANAGLIAVSEVMRALFAVRAAGIPVIVLNGGSNGCFGGMGIVARCANYIIMSEEARLAMSGPEVIETVHGVEEFDARDRALVWRTTGGKHRYLMGDCQMLVPDDLNAFRDAAAAAVRQINRPELSLQALEAEHAMLEQRLAFAADYRDPAQLWSALGVPDASRVAMMETAEFIAMADALPPVAALHKDTALTAQAAGQQEAQPHSAGWQALTARLFPQGAQVSEQAYVLTGTAQVNGKTVAVTGTCDHVPIGVEIALAQAAAVLDTVRQHPGRPVVLLVDTVGQRLRHRDEMLGINSYMAHLAKCLELARQSGHQIIALVYDQALSGGFITSGMMANACYALPEAVIRVMALPAMARITKVPEEKLTALAQDNPVFAPGPANYERMGGIQAIWHGDLAAALQEALDTADTQDRRMELGAQRGGRTMAKKVADRLLSLPLRH